MIQDSVLKQQLRQNKQLPSSSLTVSIPEELAQTSSLNPVLDAECFQSWCIYWVCLLRFPFLKPPRVQSFASEASEGKHQRQSWNTTAAGSRKRKRPRRLAFKVHEFKSPGNHASSHKMFGSVWTTQTLLSKYLSSTFMADLMLAWEKENSKFTCLINSESESSWRNERGGGWGTKWTKPSTLSGIHWATWILGNNQERGATEFGIWFGVLTFYWTPCTVLHLGRFFISRMKKEFGENQSGRFLLFFIRRIGHTQRLIIRWKGSDLIHACSLALMALLFSLFKPESTLTGNTWCDGAKAKRPGRPLGRSTDFSLLMKVRETRQCSLDEVLLEFSFKSDANNLAMGYVGQICHYLLALCQRCKLALNPLEGKRLLFLLLLFCNLRHYVCVASATRGHRECQFLFVTCRMYRHSGSEMKVTAAIVQYEQ